MKYVVIERPATGTLAIMKRKMSDSRIQELISCGSVEAVGVCQGTVLEILVASDVAEKAAGVTAGEINGTCPNHMTCLAVIGETSAVKEAIQSIQKRLDAQIK